jgi:phosphoserine phosphatase
VAVGDTHGDIEMLEFVEQPIAFNPNKTLYDYAREKGWQIVVERKNVIYQLGAVDGEYRLANAD